MGFRESAGSGASERSAAPRLVLVRHGQASLGTDDYDRLSDNGHRQAAITARRLAASLPIDVHVWSGNLRRHGETLAPLMASITPQLTRTEDLNEFSTYGLVRAALRDAEALSIPRPQRDHLLDPKAHLPHLLDWFPHVLHAWQERGMVDEEIGSWQAFHDRVTRPRAAWEELARSGRDVVVISSAGVIATLAASLADRSLEWQRTLAVRLYNASVTELAFEDGRWSVTRCNCIEHLQPEDLCTLA